MSKLQEETGKSTQELWEGCCFEATPKPIEKWSVGSYVVFLKDNLQSNLKKIGDISKIKNLRTNAIDLEDGMGNNIDGASSVAANLKWFATLTEAEEFAKTLVESVKEEVKQPLKQVVHCTTQEEWDFVLSKLPKSSFLSKQSDKFTKYNDYRRHEGGIAVNINDCGYSDIEWYKNKGCQILSFQEWCDLNRYKMEKNVKFEVGKWYKNLSITSQKNTFGKFLELHNNDEEFWMSEYIYEGKFKNAQGWLNYSSKTIEIDIEEIQQYLPEGHPDKIKSNIKFEVGDWVIVLESDSYYDNSEKCPQKISSIDDENPLKYSLFFRGGYTNSYNKIRHATPEEINNHLISIGQIPAGESLNTGIEPNKDGMFKYTTAYSNVSNNWSTRMDCGDSIADISKPKMILSIDDEELPMVNIIKTNSIKQLLNNN